MLGGYPLETIYFYALVVCAGLAVLLFIFGDIFDFDGPIDPMLIVPWVAFTSLFGYIGEKFFAGNSLMVFLIGAGISTLLVFLLNFYIVVPLRNSEATISTTEKDLEGRTATVVTPIPLKGMGEVQFKSVTGSITRPASFYEPQEVGIANGELVLIIEIRDRVCYVVPYEESFIK
ncbi:NfeD family protein [uncultured Vagococcus sp.]|uniref:NfeD family protein n=1 Tax=uncultured Vagococcus sp. TaxID=189676 RepID=UPI0028D7D64F|nr:NfeD family protein [uncultured Vagococcus sp.]